jgi:hypothetical protein
MDFLSNNLDRHGGNVMLANWQPSPRSPTLKRQGPHRLLAIDHSRSFQYTNNYDFKRAAARGQPRQLEDSLHLRFARRRSKYPIRPRRDEPSKYIGPMKAIPTDLPPVGQTGRPTFDWWGENSDKIKSTMSKRLDQIKDPEVRKHIERNFDARTNWLDERCGHGHRELRGRLVQVWGASVSARREDGRRA